MRHQRGGDLAAKVRLAACFAVERVEDRKRALVETDRKPCDGFRLFRDKRFGALEECRDILLLAGLGFQLDILCDLGHGCAPCSDCGDPFY
jgi:hypothetical protein